MNDLAEVDADAEIRPPVDQHAAVQFDESFLDVDAVLHRGRRGGKLDHHAVARGLDQVAVAFENKIPEQLQAARRQPVGFVFIHGHQPGVALDLRDEDGLQFMVKLVTLRLACHGTPAFIPTSPIGGPGPPRTKRRAAQAARDTVLAP